MKPIVLKRLDGEIEVYGGKALVIDEARLVKRGVHLYGVLTEGGEEIYEDIHLALVALVYASLQGYQPTLIGYNREMQPVYILVPSQEEKDPTLDELRALILNSWRLAGVHSAKEEEEVEEVQQR